MSERVELRYHTKAGHVQDATVDPPLWEGVLEVLRQFGLEPGGFADSPEELPLALMTTERITRPSGDPIPDPLLAKADDFTTGLNPIGGETRGLGIWLVMVFEAIGVLPLAFAKALVRSISQTPNTLPGRNLAAMLRSEHYRSLLPADLADATLEQLETLEALRLAAEATVAEFLARAEPAPSPDGPGERPDPPGAGLAGF